MSGFVDELSLTTSSGDGGGGCVSFCHEKYRPMGGPDGGDGGNGGSVFFQIRSNLKTLSHLRPNGVYKASSGRPGKGKVRHGAQGEDLTLLIPPDSIVKDAESREVLLDLRSGSCGETFLFLEGGRGGRGNRFYRSSTRQRPDFAQKGKPGLTRKILIELQLAADIGFVGFPGAGKSSLLRLLTNASPKVAAYPFTTRIPHLGVLTAGSGEYEIVLEDIPGIIDRASEGKGLGLRFLKHITRAESLLFFIDASREDFLSQFSRLLRELKCFSPALLEKPRLLLYHKTDTPFAPDGLSLLRREYPNETVLPFSTYTREGLNPLTKALVTLVQSAVKSTVQPAVQPAVRSASEKDRP